MNKLTKKQRQVYDFIDQFIKTHNYSPSYREVKQGLALGSVSTVAEHINNLVTLGYLQKTDNSARSLEVVSQAKLASVDLATKIGRRYHQLDFDDQQIVRRAIEVLEIAELEEIIE